MDWGSIESCTAIAKAFDVSKLVLFGSTVDSLEDAKDLDIAGEGIDGWDDRGWRRPSARYRTHFIRKSRYSTEKRNE